MSQERVGSAPRRVRRIEGGPLVLVVEDDPFTARQIRRILASRGVSPVVHAASVAEALGLLEPPPDWAILDIHLPDGLGLAVLQAIRRIRLPTRVVISSATTDTHLIALFAPYKPDLILPKPLNPALLPIGLGECRGEGDGPKVRPRQGDPRRVEDFPPPVGGPLDSCLPGSEAIP